MGGSNIAGVLGELMVPPSPLSCCDALALLCASRSFVEDRLKVVALYKWYCSFWVDADVESSVELLPLWRQLLVSLQSVKLAHPGGAQWKLSSPEELKIAVQALRTAETEEPREKFLGSIKGLYGNHLMELRRRWDVQGHRSNMASCSLGSVRLETREGIIDVRLLCEMRRFQSLPGEAESRGVAFYMFPLCEAVGCLWDGTEQMPKLFCQSASLGIEMRSWDLYRFHGKPGACTRGAVSFAVDEDDLRAELRMEPSRQQGRTPGENPDVADGDEVILEDDAMLWNESSDGDHYRSVLESTATAFQ